MLRNRPVARVTMLMSFAGVRSPFLVPTVMLFDFSEVRILRNARLTSSQNENLMGSGEVVRQQECAKD